MPFFRKAKARQLAAVLVGALLGAASLQPASAVATPLPGAAGASAWVPTPAVSAALRRATGYSASQLTTRPACATTAAARIRCYARVLTVRSTGRPASPRLSRAPASTTAGPAAYTPAYLQWAYDTTWLSANRGADDTVAIVDAYGDANAYSDMEQFRSANGLPSLPTCSASLTTGCFERVNQYGQTTNLPGNSNDETVSSGSGWNVEESLDIDAVSSLCPLCKILMVEANSDDSSGSLDLETAVSTAASLGADQISLSWGGDTTYAARYFESPYDTIGSAAIFAAAGDWSYPGPDVGYPAALSDVIAVGGTTLTPDATAARGFDESAWSDTESGCDTSQSVPSYQSSATTGCRGRAYNDISADADPSTGLAIYDSQSGAEGCGTANNWCIVGGTSLATPLAAAYHAITGVTDDSPAWTYDDASLLNDVTSGSDGTCPSGWSLICDAAGGWDGPTGNGSINGDLASGGPGIGGSSTTAVTATDATFAGGVYPNGASTSYAWLYWVDVQSPSTASELSGTVSGSTVRPASDTVCTLQPSTTYDYELTATNASGSETGPQRSFTTAANGSAPTTSSAAAITGSTVSGQTLVGSVTWNDAGCNSAPGYQWQESATGSTPWTTVGTGQSYTLGSADLGQYLRFTSTESNGVGSSSSTSSVVGPVRAPVAGSAPTSTAPTTSTTPTATTPTATTPTSTTPTSTTETSVPTPGRTVIVRFYRCARSCTLIATHGARRYVPRRADYGRYIKVVTSVISLDAGIRSARRSTRWVGPVRSESAGDIRVGSGARVADATTIRGTTGRTLARVRIARRSRRQVTLVLRRRGAAATRVWAYVVSSRGAVVSCTATHRLRGALRLTVALRRGQTIRLVAVST